METRFETEMIHLDGVAVLRVAGDIDASTAPMLSAACLELETMSDQLVLELGGVTFMDSSGLHVLVTTYQRAGAGSIVVRNAPDQVRRLLEITGLSDEFIEPPS